MTGVLVIIQLADEDSPDAFGGSETAQPGSRSSASIRPSPPPFRGRDDTLAGTGYTYVLPTLWLDTTEDANSSPEADGSLDSRSEWGSSGRANLLVLGPFTGLEGDLEALRDEQRRNRQAGFNGRIEDVGPREMGGVEALGLNLVRRLASGFMSDETFWVLKVEDSVYLIVSRRQDGDTLANDAFDQIYASWKWQID